MAIWPTDWFQSTTTTGWNHLGGGDVNYLGFPEIRTDFGRADSYSLAQRNTDEIPDPLCYPTSVCVDRDGDARTQLGRIKSLVDGALVVEAPPRNR